MAGGVDGGAGAACSAALLLALLVLAGLWWLADAMARDRMRAQWKAKVKRHIDDLYDAVQARALAAAAADYAGLPQPLFDLLATLKEKLGPVVELGGPMGGMVERISKALNRASTFTSPEHPTPREGTTVLIQPNPPAYLTQTHHHPSANSELQQAARDFSVFWDRPAYIKRLICEALQKLGGDELF